MTTLALRQFFLFPVRGRIQVAENDFSKNFDAFLQLQNQYVDMWKTANQKPPVQAMQDPWTSAMNSFFTSWPQQNISSNPLFGNAINQNSMMSQLMQCFEAMANNNKKDQSAEQWQSFINKSLDDLQAQVGQLGTIPFTSAPDVADMWSNPLSAWQESMQAQQFTMPGIDESWDPVSVPGLGPDREKVEKLQNLQALFQNHQSAQQQYTEAFSTFWPEVIELLKTKINRAAELDDDTVTSTRALYNLWIDAAENVYAKTTKTDAHQKCHSKVINASMSLKKALGEMHQDTLKTFDMPTRNEVDTLSERLQQTRRENRLLRKELDELKAAFLSSQKTPTPAKRKAAVKVKATAKKKVSGKKSIKKKAVTKNSK